MKAKALHLGTILVAFHCAAWIALAPVIPQLHQAFADHNHVYCLKHHRIEDADPSKIDGAVAESNRPTEAQYAASTSDATDVVERPACAFSNFVNQTIPTTPAPQCLPVSFEEREAKVETSVDIVTLKVYLLAPKHSPPLTA